MQIVLNGFIDLPSIVDEENPEMLKIQEVLRGTVAAEQSSYVGEFGTAIYDEYMAETGGIPPDPMLCTFYDAAWNFGLTFDYMLSANLEFEEPYAFRGAAEGNKFTGCTGRVFFEQGTNDRGPSTMAIQNLIDEMNELGDMEWNIKDIGVWAPGAVKTWTWYTDIIWNDGTIEVPPDTLIEEDFDCPFDPDEAEPIQLGRDINLGIQFALAMITAIITVFIWKRWKHVKIEPLATKHEMSTNDFFLMGTIFVELFQYAAMGPEFRSLSSFLNVMALSLSIDLDATLTMSAGVYWIFLEATLVLCLVWLLFGLGMIKNIDIKYEHIECCKTCGYYGENILPIIGNVMFLPIVSILLDVFICDESSDGEFENAFMYRDCYEYCW